MRPSLAALLIVLLLSPSAFGAVPIRLDIRPDGASLAKGAGEAEPTVSADGRFATFGPWIRDLTTGAVERYAFDVDGTPVLTHSASEGDVMSEDGRYVVFLDEIYDDPRLLVRDRALQTTVALPITTDGQPISSFVFNPQISRDGRVVTFHARSSNLPGGVSSTQAYLHDIASGVTELVSIPAPGGTAGGEASWASPSYDGRYVVFRSQATDMGWGMIGPQMYVRDRVAGTTAHVRRSSGGAPLFSPRVIR